MTHKEILLFVQWTRWDRVVNVMGIRWDGVVAQVETKFKVQWIGLDKFKLG